MANLAKVQFLRGERAGTSYYAAGEYAGITENEATRLAASGAVRILAVVPEGSVAASRAAGAVAAGAPERGREVEGDRPERESRPSAVETRDTKPGRAKGRR